MNSEDQEDNPTNSRESKFSAKHSSELSAASEARKLDRFIYTTERKGPQAKLFTYQGETKIL